MAFVERNTTFVELIELELLRSSTCNLDDRVRTPTSLVNAASSSLPAAESAAAVPTLSITSAISSAVATRDFRAGDFLPGDFDVARPLRPDLEPPRFLPGDFEPPRLFERDFPPRSRDFDLPL